MEVVKDPDNTARERLTRMVEAYQQPLLTMCFAYLHDMQLAEDAVQETFLRAYRALGSFRGDSSEKTWLTSIAINICRDVRRRAWFTRENRGLSIDDLPLAADQQTRDAYDLADAVMQLPARYREVILLHYYQEMTMQEIGKAIGLSTSMVSRRIKKAQSRLQAVLGKEHRDA